MDSPPASNGDPGLTAYCDCEMANYRICAIAGYVPGQAACFVSRPHGGSTDHIATAAFTRH